MKRCALIFISLILLLLPVGSFSKEEGEMTKEDYIDEIAKTKELLKAEPESSELHNTLGFYYFKIDELDYAKEEYKTAIKYDDSYSTPYNNLGVISLKKKDYEKAESYFTYAVERNPEYAKAIYNLGVTYFKQKKYVKAVRFYLKAKRMDKQYVEKRSDFKKGRAELEKALKDDPDNKVLKQLLKRIDEEDIN